MKKSGGKKDMEMMGKDKPKGGKGKGMGLMIMIGAKPPMDKAKKGGKGK